MNEIHLETLVRELRWLEQVMSLRLEEDLAITSANVGDIPAPMLTMDSAYGAFMLEAGYGEAERLLIILCFAQLFQPELLEGMLARVPPASPVHSMIGGITEKVSGRFFPTVQTALFLLAGNNHLQKAKYHLLITERHPLFTEGILRLEQPSPFNSGIGGQLLSLDKAYYYHFLDGRKVRLDETQNFPAMLLETDKTFADLVLAEDTFKSMQHLVNYARSYRQMYTETKGRLQGYVTMFYGPPGTGKTMTASVIGKELGLDVYIVNLSRVISKYIGETEKNLEVIFDRLSGKECILFFDEADALFGKRSEVNEANDRYANQEVAYLLQKIDKCSCLVILATNFKQNLDFAFTRRILTYINIHWPDEPQRAELWRRALPEPFTYASEELPLQLAKKYALTGANIGNIIKLSCYKVMADGSRVIDAATLEPFIKQEYTKERRSYVDPLSWPMK
jgi:AAA+ superfamily predicted ATPase